MVSSLLDDHLNGILKELQVKTILPEAPKLYKWCFWNYFLNSGTLLYIKSPCHPVKYF